MPSNGRRSTYQYDPSCSRLLPVESDRMPHPQPDRMAQRECLQLVIRDFGFTLGICRNWDPITEFDESYCWHHHPAYVALREPLGNLCWLIFHQIDTHIGIKHVLRTHSASRFACSCSPRASAKNSGENRANSVRSYARSEGIRTAWELQFLEIFVVCIALPSRSNSHQP